MKLIDATYTAGVLGRRFGIPAPDMVHEMSKIPAVDPESARPHGVWLHGRIDYEQARCSNCGDLYEVSNEVVVNWKDGLENFRLFCEVYHYCPNCGAKMEGSGEERDEGN